MQAPIPSQAPGLADSPRSVPDFDAVRPDPRRPTSGPSEDPDVRFAPPAARPLLLLPTLNEEEGIVATLDEFERVADFAGPGRPAVLVVDGRSTDRTVEIAMSRGATVLIQCGKGKGSAVREGLAWARRHGFTTVGVIDADGTYPADRLPALFGLLANGVDLVIGVRRPPPALHGTGRDLVHRVGNVVLNLCAAQMSRGPILDVCSGFWGLRVEHVPSLALESEGFEVESEIFVKSFRRGLHVVQFPVEYRDRIGEAKLHAVRDGARILLSIVRNSARVPSGPSSPAPDGDLAPVPARTGWTDGELTALQSTLLTLAPRRVLLVGAPNRRSELTRLAAGLDRLGVGVEILVSFLPRSAEGATRRRSPIDLPANGWDRPVVVSLPDRARNLADPGSICVEVPRGERLVLLGSGDRRDVQSAEAGDGTSRLRSAEPPLGRAGFFAVLGACFDPSGLTKESALLRANVTSVQVGLFRRASRMEASLSAVRDRLVG